MFLIQYAPEILLRTGEHLVLVAIAMLVAISIGIPLGIFITRQPKLAQPILGVANALQTIPSLAIFGFLISVPFLGGIGKIPAIVALTLYALLPLIRNTYIGINNVDSAIREAGKGMGMTDWQLLFQVEIPLASGVILAGVRVATVISVGIATIAAAIGGGGLGVFIFRGISTVNNQLILAGAIPAAFIALGADLSLGWVEKKLTEQRDKKVKINRKFTVAMGILTLLAAGLIAFNYQQTPPTIIIGSKNFTEQFILGELLAQQIESHTKLKVDRRFNLGGTFICHEAVKTGQIAGYVEYTGTSLTAVLKQKPISNSQVVYEKVKQEYDQKFKLEVMQPLGFNNTFAMIIRGEDAKRLNIKTLSEAAKYTPQLQAGFGYEFLEREDGYPGLAKTYGLKFANTKQMELGLMYQALKEKKVDLIAANSTDGLIPVLNLVILEDDKSYFPPYQAIPIFNQATLKKYPELRTSINQLAGLVSTEEMQKMNYQVDNKSRPVEQVVNEFLKSKSKL
ncbi:ABC transporter permease subunit [Anabaena cylindrica FACHB-243]|uniref:ABC-type glycine betaine transport, periplasmic subunit n=1 Tax=Anabaena cylindrica (strain ATCC 27899 / PCC 7122) TaxID=272123 RepID=K9ZBA1_ANACC|nr:MULTISPECIES: glycine betaine ABC transporter substrate-binding protein [Anabaena]AFZ56461.1 ABC-type glycine betaine transport, periplasmic subunit [Anabaena cylindrica PCC 7122]MBD2418089.1 ABC transporter permease subunit [Anabaena cylindrica FACHB-243]MBY5281934.1 ABC transporter permease subunit [Anabaena sp. CCAP 1446/1C]MBY5311343.1 ABC transporter permease subunit [Anabaena sp. CCAP 1446/1C]MCM2407366.1 ABC transporter permease subunit [Anabaena sp. CCAP 1446/1C]